MDRSNLMRCTLRERAALCTVVLDQVQQLYLPSLSFLFECYGQLIVVYCNCGFIGVQLCVWSKHSLWF